MKTFKTLIIIFLLLFFNNLFANENSERNEITKNLRCLICQGQSVYDSDSDFANSMKILVDKKLNEGLSDKEIYSYFKEKYGDWILYDPGLNKNTYLLWLLPILIFLFGGAIIVKSFIFKKFYIIIILSFFNFFSKCRRIRSKKSKYRIQCLYGDV